MAAGPDKVVRTDIKTGSAFAMPIKLFGEALKPFPRFLRTCALTSALTLETATVLSKS
jgi:hypothetical protein